MKAFSPLIEQLIQAFCCLPGVGPKSAQRMVFHLLQRDRDNAGKLTAVLNDALAQIGHCQRCRILCEHELCQLCTNSKRDSGILCIVETPADVIAIEQTASFRGLYFVLMGHLSPLDGVGPADLGLDLLERRLQTEDVNELILATNPTVEGEATAHYIAEMAKTKNIEASRIAYGVPIGSELEYIDSGTLTRAFAGRDLL